MSRCIKLTIASAMLLVASFAAAPKSAEAGYGYGHSYGYRPSYGYNYYTPSYNYYTPSYYAPAYHCAPTYGYGFGY